VGCRSISSCCVAWHYLRGPIARPIPVTRFSATPLCLVKRRCGKPSHENRPGSLRLGQGAGEDIVQELGHPIATLGMTTCVVGLSTVICNPPFLYFMVLRLGQDEEAPRDRRELYAEQGRAWMEIQSKSSERDRSAVVAS